MDDLSFLDAGYGALYGADNATLKVMLADGRVCPISDRICPYRFLDSCPLLYHAFEHGHQNRLQASIEASSRSAVICLVRYCYTGSYCVPNAEFEPIFILPHAETYKIAEDFDVPGLQLLANGTFSCQIELACSLPTPPQDLDETIRFIYLYFSSQQSRQQQSLLSSLLNYCIAMFQYHRLATDSKFLAVARDIPEFRQDLCRTNMERNFQDDCALEIIGLALHTLQPQPSVRPTALASRDLPEEMLFDIPESSSCTALLDVMHNGPNATKNDFSDKSDARGTVSDFVDLLGFSTSGASTLVCRPRSPQFVMGDFVETDSPSEDEGFSLVHRPKLQPSATPNDPMSSPEFIPHPVDILALTGSDYPSDDEWTML